MRFEVPQFIEVEDKLFGPLTFKQFIYLAGGVGFAVALFLSAPMFITILLGGPVLLFAVALAFFKVNDRPFVLALQSGINYYLRNRLYLWKKEDKKIEQKQQEPVSTSPYVPKLSDSKLKDLAWSLDIKESLYEDESHAR